MLKVIVAGGREFDTFEDYEKLKAVLGYYLSSRDPSEIEIVSGVARGADSLGERYAKEFGLAVKQFPADWDRFGKKAGPFRNAQMAYYADALIAFDTGGRGTAHMIDLARRSELKIRVVDCKKTN